MKTLISIIKKIPFLAKLVKSIRQKFGITTLVIDTRVHKKHRNLVFNNYFENNKIERKLQIGCQGYPFFGWLNVDIEPKNMEIAYMDATKPFPFPDETFDYIYSEHMIEHISFENGLFMLHECFRVLKKGGRIRIATPDLLFLIKLYNKEKTETQKKYIEFSKRYINQNIPITDATMINNFFRAWGHQFIYDQKSLKYSMGHAGFIEFKLSEVNKSEDANLCNLEKHGLEIGEGFNILETIVVEAKKTL